MPKRIHGAGSLPSQLLVHGKGIGAVRVLEGGLQGSIVTAPIGLDLCNCGVQQRLESCPFLLVEHRDSSIAPPAVHGLCHRGLTTFRPRSGA